MAKSKEVVNDYTMSQADLMQLGDDAVGLMNRDAAELVAYGIDAVDRDFVADKTQEFKDFPTDEELETTVSERTEEKDAAAENVRVAIRSIIVRAKNAFGVQSAKYRKFGLKDLNNVDDNGLLRLGKRVVRTAELYLAALAPEGLTQQIIDDLKALNEVFDDAIDAKDDAMEKRDTATEDRILLGNLLYNKIVKVYAAGRDYWYTKSEAKYNDYVIYDSSPSKPKIKVVLATKQNPPDKVVVGLKGKDGKVVNTKWGDGNSSSTTVNNTDYTLAGNTYLAGGNYQIEMEGEVPAFDGIIAANDSLSAVNLPKDLDASEYDFSNNNITSIIFHPENTSVKKIDLKNNKLDLQSTNLLLTTVDAHGTSGGYIDLSGPDMSTPTGAGLTAKANLESRGWTVITN